jgi:hypothetical protein
MNRLSPILLIFLIPIFGACARWQRPLSAAAAAAGAGYIGHELSDGDPAITAAAAAGGALLSEGAHAWKRRGERKAYVEGYTRGRSDGAKSLYRQLVDQQRTQPPGGPTRLIPVTLPERTEDGAVLKPSTRILRIQE